MQPEAIKEEDSVAEQREHYDQRPDQASMEEAAQDDDRSLEDEHMEENGGQEYGDLAEQDGQDHPEYHDEVYDDINGEGEPGQSTSAIPCPFIFPGPHLSQCCTKYWRLVLPSAGLHI